MSDNPLKNYFRRPAIYINLDTGQDGYQQEVLEPTPNGEYPVYPMTAIDEITSRTPDALYNGQAMVDIIKSCIPAFKNPWEIKATDLDTILIAIRIASTGENMDVICGCPKCETENKFGVNLTQLLSIKRKGNYQKPLSVRDLKIKFRPLTLKETNKNNLVQYEVQKMLVEFNNIEDEEEKRKQTKTALDQLSGLTTEIIASTIEYIQTPETIVADQKFIKEFLSECDRQLNTLIREQSIKLREETMLPQLKIQCMNCQHQFEQPLILNITDFFA